MEYFSLDDWLSLLENRQHEEIKLNLDRISQVAGRLDLLTPSAKVITIAGTNGKGSTVACLEELYTNAGLSVGVYTSPHLFSFNERIKVNKTPISDNELCKLFHIIEVSRQNIELSYFEMATLAALLHFKRKSVEIILLEVGMGGRLDATNIINPDLSIITTINFDHQKYLGATLEEIAIEKAGIMRRGKPVIYADTICQDVMQDYAMKVGAKLYAINKDFSFAINEQNQLTVNFLEKVENYQLDNINFKAAGAAIVAVKVFSVYFNVADKIIYKSLQSVNIPGRLQYLSGNINYLFDVSHNIQSVELLSDFLVKVKKDNAKVHAVFSALKDKDLSGLIGKMQQYVDYWYPVELNVKRACNGDDILNILNLSGEKHSICYDNALSAFKKASKCAKIGDLIVVYGSFSLVGPVLKYYNEFYSSLE